MMFHKIAIPLLNTPRVFKRLIVLTIDACICVLSVWIAFYLRTGELVSLMDSALPVWVGSLIIALPIFVVFGFYRAIFRYSGLAALKTIAMAISIYSIIFFCVFTAFGVQGVPRTIGLLQPLLVLFGIGASRLFARYWLGDLYRHQIKLAHLPKVLIYGAGNAGRQLAAAMLNSHEMRVIGFLDDDERLHGQVLNGINIYAPTDLPSLVESFSISSVLLALPSIARKRRNEILKRVTEAKVAVRTLPSVTELAQGKVSLADLRELDVDDLLGRVSVEPNHDLLEKNILGKVVMVTGAGGSIGSELCRQIVSLHPSRLLLVEQSEFALYTLHNEIGMEASIPLLASVCDSVQMDRIIATWKPQTIYHAAAYKHVPIVEHNPVAGVSNNVMGTLVTAQAAQRYGVENFVLISTDKAVRPTNIMGASKRLAEMVLQALAETAKDTRFSMVRFGNVLGSSGSVVPRFRQQIRDGGPISLTHPDITRYFMTIPEAAQLVIQAGALGYDSVGEMDKDDHVGSAVFVLDMGKPVRIYDLAKKMVELSGLTLRDEHNLDGDIEISISGLRPGEKLFEELLIGDDPKPTSHPRIMKAHEAFLPWDVLKDHLADLQKALSKNDIEVIKRQLKDLVLGYQPSDEIVDWVYSEERRNAINLQRE